MLVTKAPQGGGGGYFDPKFTIEKRFMQLNNELHFHFPMLQKTLPKSGSRRPLGKREIFS